MRYFLSVCFITLFFSNNIFSQGCCSGGSGSPIAGGSSQGVLNKKQLEIAANYQYQNTSKFYTEDKDTIKLFNKLYSNYMYFRAAYGVTKEFTMSVEGGYFVNKIIREFDNKPDYESSGIGDIILFPRYDLYYRVTDSSKTEITVGLGVKIPVGSHNDSTVIYTDPNSGQKLYTISPLTVQPTNGSQDLIFYAFFFRGYPLKNLRLFANCMYIKKGWNPLGQKFGDYASIGLFAGTTLFKKIGVTLQLKGEWIDKMQYDKKVDMLAFYNVDVLSTGGYKVVVAPQVSYTKDNFTMYIISEIPLYQYVNGVQVGSQYHFTAGLAYRFCL